MSASAFDPFAASIADTVLKAVDEWEGGSVHLLCSDNSVLITRAPSTVDRFTDACVGTFNRNSSAADIAAALEHHWGLDVPEEQHV